MNNREEAINKIIDYSLYKNKQNSDMYIKFVSNNIKRCEKEIEKLSQEKIMFHTKKQRKKLKNYRAK